MPQLRPVDLEGRVALVVGGAGEVGGAFVDLLGSAGAEVAVADEPGPTLSRMAIRLGIQTYECDPADPESPRAAATEIVARLGHLDLLICVLGPSVDAAALSGSLQEAARTTGAGGRILLVGSAAEAAPVAIGLAAEGIVANAVLHGPLRPPEPEDWVEEAPVPEPGTLAAADVARAALWLLDPEVEGVSGVVAELRGGS